MAMSDDLKAIEEQVKEGLAKVSDPKELDSLRVKTLGRKGSLTALMHMMGQVPADQRPAMGKLANTVRANVDMAIKNRAQELAKEAMSRRMSAEAVDVTLPGRRAGRPWPGRLRLQLRFLQLRFLQLRFGCHWQGLLPELQARG